MFCASDFCLPNIVRLRDPDTMWWCVLRYCSIRVCSSETGSKANNITLRTIQQSKHSYKGRYILVVSYRRSVGSLVNWQEGGRGTNHPKRNFLRTVRAQNAHYGCETRHPPPIWPGSRGLRVACSVGLGLQLTMSRQWWGVDSALTA